jgi:hypothetical protein
MAAVRVEDRHFPVETGNRAEVDAVLRKVRDPLRLVPLME